MMIKVRFQPWNDITETVQAIKARKQKAAELAYQRDLHADIVRILNDSIPRNIDMKRRAEGIDAAADDVIEYFQTKTINTKQDNPNATS